MFGVEGVYLATGLHGGGGKNGIVDIGSVCGIVPGDTVTQRSYLSPLVADTALKGWKNDDISVKTEIELTKGIC